MSNLNAKSILENWKKLKGITEDSEDKKCKCEGEDCKCDNTMAGLPSEEVEEIESEEDEFDVEEEDEGEDEVPAGDPVVVESKSKGIDGWDKANPSSSNVPWNGKRDTSWVYMPLNDSSRYDVELYTEETGEHSSATLVVRSANHHDKKVFINKALKAHDKNGWYEISDLKGIFADALKELKKLKHFKDDLVESSDDDIDALEKKKMREWLEDAFDKYNDLMDDFAKINVRDDEIKKEWAKVDKAFDGIAKIFSKKYGK